MNSTIALHVRYTFCTFLSRPLQNDNVFRKILDAVSHVEVWEKSCLRKYCARFIFKNIQKWYLPDFDRVCRPSNCTKLPIFSIINHPLSIHINERNKFTYVLLSIPSVSVPRSAIPVRALPFLVSRPSRVERTRGHPYQ